MESGSKAVSITISVVIGLVVGGAIGWMVGMSHGKSAANNADMSSSQQSSADGVMVGGARMVPDKNIVANAENAKNVTTLVSLVGKAGLVSTLEGPGPFTVFAPNNDAFNALPKSTVDSLQEPKNKAQLQTILEDHVVSGTYTSAALKVMAQKGETLTSLGGEVLTPVMKDGQLEIQDGAGSDVMIQTADVISSNGVTHVVEAVLMPKS